MTHSCSQSSGGNSFLLNLLSKFPRSPGRSGSSHPDQLWRRANRASSGVQAAGPREPVPVGGLLLGEVAVFTVESVDAVAETAFTVEDFTVDAAVIVDNVDALSVEDLTVDAVEWLTVEDLIVDLIMDAVDGLTVDDLIVDDLIVDAGDAVDTCPRAICNTRDAMKLRKCGCTPWGG